MVRLYCFNPSQVQFTPLAQHTYLAGSIAFQSLTGSIHTTIHHGGGMLHIIVSIPHRFNSHPLIVLTVIWRFLRFNPSQVQFTLRNKNVEFVGQTCFNPSQVQFTHTVIKPSNYGLRMFQSLTGSIHTDEGTFTELRINEVSIPHRFNSHLTKFCDTGCRIICFNPSQVQFTQYFPMVFCLYH